MTTALGVIMDPIGSIKVKKDSTLAMLLAAQARDWPLWYMEPADLFARDGTTFARMRELSVSDDSQHWFEFGDERTTALRDLDVILMRKDPPFDMEYVFATYLLELAEMEGALVVNKPQALRDANEKFFISWFSQYTPPTLVTSSMDRLRAFVTEQNDCILKPLDTMGGASIFRVRPDDPNINVTFETLTNFGTRTIMAQRFIPEIKDGDKRILMIDGEPIPYALARLAAPGETRANLATGGRGEGVALSDRDREICDEVGPVLRQKSVLFAGLDVIGDYLTEVNVTSPTCIRELDALYDLNIGAQLMDAIVDRLTKR